MNEITQALSFLAQSLIAKDRVIEQLQGQIAELQKKLAEQPQPQTAMVQ